MVLEFDLVVSMIVFFVPTTKSNLENGDMILIKKGNTKEKSKNQEGSSKS